MPLAFERKLRQQPRAFCTDAELQYLLPSSTDARKAVIKRAVAQGLLIRIKRGLYCIAEEIGLKKINSFELAQFIYGLSCISLESALSYYGLIPEAVYTTTSVTIKRSKKFSTPIGEYDYCKVPSENFLIAVNRVEFEGIVFFIASPWRVLTDYVYCYKKDWDSLLDLENDLRLSVEDLPKVSSLLAENLKDYYRNKRVDAFIDTIMQGFFYED